jgi:hypothetical protein
VFPTIANGALSEIGLRDGDGRFSLLKFNVPLKSLAGRAEVDESESPF